MTANETPASYIHFAARNPRDIRIPVFESMLGKLFTHVDNSAAGAFRDFYAVSHTPGQERLLAPFYKAVRQGFEHLRAGSPACAQKWGALFAGIIDLIESDDILTRDVNDRLLAQVVPHAIRNLQATDTDWRTASDILQAVGKVPAVAEKVDPRLPHDIVKWHMRQCNHDFSHAAGRLTELRATAAFVPSIASIENHAGIHVAAHAASVKTDHTSLKAENRLLVLRFEQAHNHVVALSLDPTHKNHPIEEIDLCGSNTRYRPVWAEMLLHQYCDELPEQAWVAPIAMQAYSSLEA